jgi:NAD(P)H-hydrate repair Nnr-like enzyme with NAD(P)H-hydrate dehydratase domain
MAQIADEIAVTFSCVTEIAKVEIAKLDLRPGNILLVKFPDGWSMDQANEFAGYIRALIPSWAHVVLAPHDAEFSIISQIDDQSKSRVGDVLAAAMRVGST